MDIKLARHLLRSAFRSSRELGELVPLLKEKLPPEEYERYARAIATTIASIQLDVVNLLTAEHPGLESELETSIAIYGKYFESGASTAIATRVLVLREAGTETEIPITLHAPEQEGGAWICRFEIGWPEGSLGQWAGGIDAVQALHGALQMIGVLLYTSDHHKAGRLRWYEEGSGYGFPLVKSLPDLFVGDDAKYL